MFAFFYHYYGLTEYEGNGVDSSAQENNQINDSVQEQIEKTGLSDSEAEQIKNENDRAVAEIEVEDQNSADVYNLLLVGVDRRETNWNGNADSIILAPINRSRKTIMLMSFMRDLYANIPGYGVHKLNAACAYGGCSLLVQIIEENYKVQIDNYAWVDFKSMADIIDALGGVDITLSDEEAESANGAVYEMCMLFEIDPETEYFHGGGALHCDGIQTVAYGRIRYVGNSDYQRTERQRAVMTQMIQKIGDMSLGELNSFATTVLPMVHHDISASTVLSLISSATEILNYEVDGSRVPFDGYFEIVKEVLNPDMGYTISEIQKELYK